MAQPRPQLPDIEPTYDPNRPFPDVVPLFNNKIPTCPGKSIVALRVMFAPNGSTPPHTHAGAFISGYVMSGWIFNKMNDDPMVVHGPGETFTENPGCRHRISNNASTIESAVLIATMIVDTKVIEDGGLQGLVVIDPEYRDMVENAHQKAKQDAGGKA